MKIEINIRETNLQKGLNILKGDINILRDDFESIYLSLGDSTTRDEDSYWSGGGFWNTDCPSGYVMTGIDIESPP